MGIFKKQNGGKLMYIENKMWCKLKYYKNSKVIIEVLGYKTYF